MARLFILAERQLAFHWAFPGRRPVSRTYRVHPGPPLGGGGPGARSCRIGICNPPLQEERGLGTWLAVPRLRSSGSGLSTDTGWPGESRPPESPAAFLKRRPTGLAKKAAGSTVPAVQVGSPGVCKWALVHLGRVCTAVRCGTARRGL